MMFGRTQIAEAYLGSGTASDVAKRLNEHHRTNYFTVSRVLTVWTSLYLANPPLRELGERPRAGFDQANDLVKLAHSLMAAS